MPFSFVVGDETWTGRLCALKAQDDSFQHIILADILAQRVEDPSFVHKDFLKYCLTQSFDVPKALMVETLAEHIRESADASVHWILVQGFPKTLGELIEFERKVSNCLGVRRRPPRLIVPRSKSRISVSTSSHQMSLSLVRSPVHPFGRPKLIQRCT